MDVIKREGKKALLLITNNHYIRLGFEHFLEKHRMFNDDFYLITLSYDTPDAIFEEGNLDLYGEVGFVITDHLKAEVISYIYPEKSSSVITYDKQLTDYIVLFSRLQKEKKVPLNIMFSKRERICVYSFIKGMSIKETALRLGCSIKTESHYRRKVLRKLHCRSEAQFLKLIKEKYNRPG